MCIAFLQVATPLPHDRSFRAKIKSNIFRYEATLWSVMVGGERLIIYKPFLDPRGLGFLQALGRADA